MEMVAPPETSLDELSTSPSVGSRFALVFFILIGLFGLAVRIWALGRHAINADQAVVGLMAEQILHGHLSAFYWGQAYGGGEPYIVALVFAVFGQSTFSLGLTPVLLDLVAAILLWRIGSRLFGPRIGIEAALLFWIWPEVYIWQSTIEYGFRWFVLDCGLLAVLLTLRVISSTSRHRMLEIAAIGGSLGLGWWGSPEIMYFALPIFFYLLYAMACQQFRIHLRELFVGIVAAAIGASAWIEANVVSHFASLRSGVQPDPGILHHLKVFVQHAIPLLLGLQLKMTGRWIIGLTAGNIVNYLAVALCVALVVVLAVRREAMFLVIFCLFAPLIYGLSPFTWYWNDGRYAVFLAPAASLLVIVGAREVLSQRAIAKRIGSAAVWLRGSVVIALGLALTLVAMSESSPYHPDGVRQTGSESWTSWTSDPGAGFSNVARQLRADGIDGVYAGYWIAYPLMFASKGTITASDVVYVRNPKFLSTLEQHRSTAWLMLNPKDYRLGVALTGVSLMNPSCAVVPDRCLLPRELVSYLHQNNIAYREYTMAPFLAIVPSRPISPAAINAEFHLRSPYTSPK